MRVIIILISLFFNLIPSLSLAEERYTVGRRSCDFQAAEEYYHNHHESEAMYAIGLYGVCLVLKGLATNDPEVKGQGLLILFQHTEPDGFNDVEAMFFLAEYLKTNGKFDGTTDEGNIDMAIRAYYKTLSFIHRDDTYPIKYLTSEQEDQMEIFSFYMIPELYSYRYEYGWIGSHNIYLNDSPSYTGNKADLNFYLAYNRDHDEIDLAYSDLSVIKDSLNQMISSSEACLNLPYKPLYHRRDIYDSYRKSCEILNVLGRDLLALEQKRQNALYNESCKRDILQCDEYMEVYHQMDDVIQDTIRQLRAIPNPWRS